ncbi:MAG: hypothetical protein IPM97_11000 [Bdellovibrionaceae bacterium]|nr:hypothetical protein [Pseudobdellovibrionaceae bacterium]
MLGTAGTDIGISSAGSAHTFDIPTASATKRGALSSADWSTFNSKMSNALTSANIWVGNSGNAATAVSMSGDATMSNAGVVTVDKTTTAQANKILALDGSSVAVTKGNQLNGATSGSLTLMPAAVTTNYSLTFPGAQGASGQVLSNNGAGVLSWASAMTNSLTSANIWVGNSGNAATAVSMSGDATMSNAGVVTLANSGVTAGTYAKVSVDAKGRVIASASLSAADINTALTYTPVNKAGDTMAGALAMGTNNITNTGNITMAANKYFTLSANTTNGTTAGQMWYDTGTIKYYDGSVVKSLGVAGTGITTLNGLSTATQSFVLGTAGTDIGISSAGSAHTFDIPTASATKRGALSSADWSTFNSKMSNSLTSANIWVGNSGNAATAVSMSGDATMSNAGVVTLATSGVTAGSYAKVSVDAKGRVIAGLSMTSSDITTALGFTPAGAATAFVQNGNIFGATAVLGTNDANSVEFETNNSTKMTILSSGNVGIGTTTPGSKLEVAGNITGYNSGVAVDALIEAKHFSANAGNSGAIQFLRARGTSAAPTQPQSGDQLGAIRAQNAVNPNSWPGIYFNTTENHSASAQGSAISFHTTANGTVGGTERMRIDHNGNVGIGTTAPPRLHRLWGPPLIS